MRAPKAFISYSHDSDDHKQWVLQKLANPLMENGVETALDLWDLKAGQDVAAFMTAGISESDRVIMVCSENYVHRANDRKGGVGYEGAIITGELVQNIDTQKFLPVIRANAAALKMPTYLGARKFIDFCNDADYVGKLEELLREIHGQPSIVKPPLGASPFSGAPSATPPPTRLAGPSGLTAAGEPVLSDGWFTKHAVVANRGLDEIGRTGAMELRFALHDPISKSQLELLNAVRQSEIHTFGWPIGVTLENRDEYRPRPSAEGIVAEIKLNDETSRKSYDYWTARSNGDFYLLQSLFEDDRAVNKMFVDTRLVRITEALLFCSNLYSALGVVDNARISIRVRHQGLVGRQLTTASQQRHIIPTQTNEDVSETQLVETLGQIRPKLVDTVIKVAEPLFMLFDFKQLNRVVYEEIVTAK
jgi:hypothetical protein